MPPISLLIKPVSGMCNMKCDYCFYRDETHKRSQECYGFMSEKTLKNVIRKTVLTATGSCSLAFQGGEPTLCGLEFFKRCVELVGHYNRRKIQINYSLQTNGYNLTEEWCQFLSENHFLTGISVDGLEFTHDAYRKTWEGAPTYQRIMENIQRLEHFGCEYNILTVVHKQTARHIKEIYREYRRRGWDYMQFIPCLDPLGEVPGSREYSLLPGTSPKGSRHGINCI